MTTTDDVTDRKPAAKDKDQSAKSTGIRAYREVVKTPGMPAWTFVTLCQRLPIAMSPLALVFLGHLAGSYAIGALLAGAFAFAEAVAAGVMGRRFDRRRAGPEVRLVLSIQAVVLLLLGVPTMLDPGSLPVWLMIALAALAGGIASGAHGGLRALLVRTVPSKHHHAALSLEATMTTLLWAIGPAVVGVIALVADPVWPIIVIAAVAAVGALGATRLRDPGRSESADGDGSDVRVWRLSWPALFQEGAILMCVGAAYTGLPSLLETVGTDAGVSGPVLAAFALAGLVGGLTYGSRKWPGAYRQQALVLVLAVTAIVAIAVSTPVAALIIPLLILSGLGGTPALTARAAGMQEMLPERVWATGFSGLYAAGGVGFGIAGLVIAVMLESVGIRGAMLICVAIAAVATVISGIAEARMAKRRPNFIAT